MSLMIKNGKTPPTPSAPPFGSLCNWMPSPKRMAVPAILHPLSSILSPVCRLPKTIREQLNRRLENGEKRPPLVASLVMGSCNIGLG